MQGQRAPEGKASTQQRRSKRVEQPLLEQRKLRPTKHDIVGEVEVTAMIQSAYQEASAC